MCQTDAIFSRRGSFAHLQEAEQGSHRRELEPPVPQGLHRGTAALIQPKLILAELNFFQQFADGKGVGRPGVSSSAASTCTAAPVA